MNGAYSITNEFDANSKKADDANKIKQSQQALDKLGFSIDTPTTAYSRYLGGLL